MIKLIFFFLLIISIPNISLAQAYKDSIKTQFFRYTELLSRKDFTQATNYLNQAFFKYVPKLQLVNLMEKTYNNPDLDFEVSKPIIESIGDSKSISGQSFVKLQYSNYLSMHFKSAGEKRLDTALTRAALENQFGKGNVTYNSSSDIYKVFVTKNVIANSLNNRNWTFVVVEEKQKPLLEKFIPKEVL